MKTEEPNFCGMVADVESVELVETLSLPPGEYRGRWRGKTVRLSITLKSALRHPDSVGDMDVACIVKVDESGQATVEF
jgi:hypothetical protein